MKSFTAGLSKITNSQPSVINLPSPDLVVIGTSLGGLYALKTLLAGIPASFPASIVIVQHRHKNSDVTFTSFLQDYSALPLKEVEDKEVIKPSCVYIAPADYHLLVEVGEQQSQDANQHRRSLALSTEAPVSYARPSIDVLFESAAEAYAEKIIGVILTGASTDGAKGLAAIKEGGGLGIVQEPSTAESVTMPQAAIAAAPPDWVLPLEAIAPLLIDLCQPRQPLTEFRKNQNKE